MTGTMTHPRPGNPQSGRVAVTDPRSYEVVLAGARPEPLGAYLVALGVLRIVGDQADPTAAGFWADDTFVLRSALDADGLIAFFRDRYRPTPVVSPWNNGSGFKDDGKKPKATGALKTIEASTDERLASYRATINAGRHIYRRAKAEGWVDDKKYKAMIVELCRAEFPDDALAWLDTAILTTSTERGLDLLATPPLLGTGGNDGNFDFSVGFMGRLIDALGLAKPRSATAAAAQAGRRESWLRAALLDDPGDEPAPLVRETGGYFSPGAVGGVSASSSGTGEALVNPWSWVLMLEGTLMFASAPARRLGSASGGRTSAPFTVSASAAGVGSTSAEEARSSRGEIWTPLWSRPATVGEITRLLGEGRAEWSGRQARNGLDLARAAASLGVDRGIDAFARHALVTRNGLSTLAVPVGRVAVSRERRPEVRLTAQLDPWLGRVRSASKELPAAVRSGLGAVEEALFWLTQNQRRRAVGLLDVLMAVAALDAAIGRSATMRNAGVPPVSRLNAADWLPALLDHAGVELRLAAALASLRDPQPRSTQSPSGGPPTRLRELLRPVRLHGGPRNRSWAWTGLPAPVDGIDTGNIVDVLARVLVERAQHSREPQHPAPAEPPTDSDPVDDSTDDNADETPVGRADAEPAAVGTVETAFRFGVYPRLRDVAALIVGDLDDAALARTLSALLLLDWNSAADRELDRHVASDHEAASTGAVHLLPPAAALILPMLSCQQVRWQVSTEVERRPQLAPQTTWPRRLAADQLTGLLPEVALRLRMAGIGVVGADAAWSHAATPALGPALAAAGLLRLKPSDVRAMLRLVAPPDPAVPTTAVADPAAPSTIHVDVVPSEESS